MRELGAPVYTTRWRGPIRKSALPRGVLDILASCSDKEMIRVDAGRRVTGMADLKTRRYLAAVGEFPRMPMRRNVSAPRSEMPIALPRPSKCPH